MYLVRDPCRSPTNIQNGSRPCDQIIVLFLYISSTLFVHNFFIPSFILLKIIVNLDRERLCEKVVVRKTLWERQCEIDVVRKIKKSPFFFNRYIWVINNLYCIGLGLRISDAYVFPVLTMLNQKIIESSRGIEGL